MTTYQEKKEALLKKFQHIFTTFRTKYEDGHGDIYNKGAYEGMLQTAVNEVLFDKKCKSVITTCWNPMKFQPVSIDGEPAEAYILDFVYYAAILGDMIEPENGIIVFLSDERYLSSKVPK